MRVIRSGRNMALRRPVQAPSLGPFNYFDHCCADRCSMLFEGQVTLSAERYIPSPVNFMRRFSQAKDLIPLKKSKSLACCEHCSFHTKISDCFKDSSTSISFTLQEFLASWLGKKIYSSRFLNRFSFGSYPLSLVRLAATFAPNLY